MDNLRKIYIEPTNVCNLNCRTCIRHVWDEPTGYMEWDTYVALIDGLGEFPGAETVAFAGFGEPLMHPRFVDMVRLAHERGLRTEMTTNALLIDLDMARALLDAGLDQLVVSIDGSSAEAFNDVRTGASLSTVIKNVQSFWQLTEPGLQPPLTIGIEFVAMKRNVAELPGLQWVAKLVGASFILVSNVLPYSAELEDEVLYNQKVTAFNGEGSPWTPRWILPRMDFSEYTREPLGKLFRSQTNLSYLDMNLNARNSHCPFVGEDCAAVDWQGRVCPCPALMHAYRCIVMGRPKVIRPYHVGSIRDESLLALWEQADYAAFRQRVRDFDFSPCVDCGGCYMAETNEEDCFGNTFPVCGDCLWARGVIRCA
jgi:MoaA/NifB/PqqE/SkfB family radical SAM enzyme